MPSGAASAGNSPASATAGSSDWPWHIAGSAASDASVGDAEERQRTAAGTGTESTSAHAPPIVKNERRDTICGDDTPLPEQTLDGPDVVMERLAQKHSPLGRQLEAFAKQLDGASDELGQLMRAMLRDDWTRVAAIAEASHDPGIVGIAASRCDFGRDAVCMRVPAARWTSMDPGNLVAYLLEAQHSGDSTEALRHLRRAVAANATQMRTGDELITRRLAQMGFANQQQASAVLLKLEPMRLELVLANSVDRACPDTKDAAALSVCKGIAIQVAKSEFPLHLRFFAATIARAQYGATVAEVPPLPKDVQALIGALSRRGGSYRGGNFGHPSLSCDKQAREFRFDVDRLDRDEITLAREQLAREAERPASATGPHPPPSPASRARGP
ncbi:hypothetical protein ACNI65_12080 [Roseateles sp. So40a]|uniref:hypothetical protein n=1 Tax=Roseateles sp. So40a TaxID=3400226 RepID=UPI003A86DD5E